jgi:DNA-binding IclR family transcriptional regulator
MVESAPVGTTARALAVLAVFTADAPRQTLSEISRQAHLPLSSTHRLVGELTRWGALERDVEGRYSIGLRLWELGSLAPRSIELRDAARPVMQDLYEITHENVQIAVLDEREVVYVERVSGRQAVHVVTRPGTRMPPHATAVGLVLLAHSTPALVEEILDRPLRKYTEHTLTDPRRLRRVLAEVRRQGYAISDRQIEVVSASVAAPIHDRAGAVVAALSLVVPAAGGWARRYSTAVQASARAISRNLAAPG